ncbi:MULTISPECIES: hypothetical protein [Sphingomonadales]|jgi:hypothetical protein|uniref:Uncharacterized protein n=2 Tax=Sphingomonadales TaxID=204457 RepID=A0A0G3XNL0_9SPHN|nr:MULTISPECIES: hypothetical protein [Sphingomonadales]MCP5233711.1 hypothetical protein [Zoogloeaceae bacterium]AIT82691.1 hypothetical protein JI59_24895 [Novosphingobium pentaromativorans US6-1]AKM12196.1 hypothetical protein AB433_18850 [Croceicoccus naphthovorans]EHJ58079.1 hypothetical protein NSU_pLA1185 [Novosphingobium pentaromativorans US6-1]MBB3991055.1 hypothetical protein [Croceicoccus naphthovorans]
MPHRSLTPDTVFMPRPSADEPSAFSFGPTKKPLTEQDRYKLLIIEQAAKQALPLGHLADRIGAGRSRLHKVLRNGAALSDELRDRLFDALELDPVRAKFCVVFLHNQTAYDDPSISVVCEAMKGFCSEVLSCRRGELHVSIRPQLIHEALGRTYEMLLKHQERVLEVDDRLFE